MPYIKVDNNQINCFSLKPLTKGNVWPVPVVDTEIWHVPGVDGLGVGLGSLKDPEIEIECTGFGTKAEVVAWIRKIEALLGMTVEMVSNLDQKRQYVCVLEIIETNMDGALIPGENITTKGTVKLKSVVKFTYSRQPGKLSIYNG